MNDAVTSKGIPRAEGILLGLGVLLAAASMTSVAITQIALALMLILGLLGIVRGWWHLPRTGLERPLLIFTGWALLTIPFSSDPSASLVASKRFFLMTALWAGALVARDERARAWLLGGLLAGSVGNAVYSLATEVVGGESLTHRIGLVQNSTITGAWIMAVAAVVAVAVAVVAPSWRARLAGWASFPFLMGALIFTWTRSGWMGVVAGIGVVMLLMRPRWIPALLVVLAIVVAAGPANMRDRLTTIVDPEHSTNAQRVALWEIGVDLIREHPVTGVGDQRLHSYAKISSPDARGNIRHYELPHLHQNQIMMATLWGLPGLALGSWVLFAMAWRLWRRWRDVLRERGRWPSWRLVWLVGALGTWAVVNVAGIADWTFGDAELSPLFFFVTGAALGRGAASQSA